ncbi:cyclic 2,3-diphosphoglycerate synthase [Mesoterricola sediminis]|uniref:GTPase n=1 Tax=Mesoterricola sediminis TaxID=2927980 RepID=A0AA48H0G2_9BACT|nr:cyclic 2,3-diphosphoglycerate synthase [Mesoterricola sediminis]BDU77745.1 GTPase [Mesoterricola sediminis]
MSTPRRVVILGAAGRDFHNFNTVYRDNPDYQVVAFTATQIPGIEGRLYPAVLAGKLYPAGIPIVPESELVDLIRREKPDVAVFSYSDVTHEYVGHMASQCIALGVDFELLGADKTMIKSKVPVIAITAVRTGAGKSQTTRYISNILKGLGKKVVAIRHPMPYGDLAKQACQRFGTYADLDLHACTIEEREEYEPHIDNGFVVYAGVDYEQIIRSAEKEADVILWDGGNNDLPFYASDLHIVIADPLRPGHEQIYHPGEANFRRADVIVINKCDSAKEEDIKAIEAAAARLNPKAAVIRANSPVTCEKPEMVKGKNALIIEDGPTLTHGSMSYGAGVVAARKVGVGSIVDPTPYAVKSIAFTYNKYPNARGILPAMGYGPEQVADLEQTIEATPCDVVVSATPIDITRVLKVSKPMVRVAYELAEVKPGQLAQHVEKVAKAACCCK